MTHPFASALPSLPKHLAPGLVELTVANLDRSVSFYTGAGDGVTELRQTERFSGLLVTLSKGTLDDVGARLRQWTAAIKRRAEERGEG